MIYEWRCRKCDLHQEVQRTVDEYNVPPDDKHDWVKVYNYSTPFEHLRNSGVLADDNGNFAPRKL